MPHSLCIPQIKPERQHVIDAVFLHGFIDADDWSRGLGELARMSDAEIEELAAKAFAERKGWKE